MSIRPRWMPPSSACRAVMVAGMADMVTMRAWSDSGKGDGGQRMANGTGRQLTPPTDLARRANSGRRGFKRCEHCLQTGNPRLRMDMPRDTLAEVSDDTLLVLYANGDREASRLLTARLSAAACWAMPCGLLADRAEAEDVTQEAMLRLWKVAPELAAGRGAGVDLGLPGGDQSVHRPAPRPDAPPGGNAGRCARGGGRGTAGAWQA